ncbi:MULTISPECIES: helix-turn-helix domain-containing protein [unclassified Vibrio]|uniref:HTH cro/C1-type domain-containing protein n=1 Tax=Vibrio proteolyticus NBRC 13287 TaxID=1219065 RepID=U2ZVJ3_VIBPR|nr:MULTISPECIES: helix-turn-helix domain-containing protein [unclassified Vibrio]GAD65455.1 hypothetical protein VPR01S_01_02280 [Vibrio proteolyticus NBRC 13287]
MVSLKIQEGKVEPLHSEICRQLKLELKRAGVSYKALSEHLGVSEVSVKRLLNQQQPLSISRVCDIADLVGVSVSQIMARAEEAVSAVPVFSDEQDAALYEHQELYTLLDHMISDRADADWLMKKYDLDEASMYLYLRDLEKLGLINLISGLRFRVAVPRHIAFSESHRFPSYFKNQVLEGLKERVQCIKQDNKSAYFITSKLRLTEEEFQQYNLGLEAMMMDALQLSQSRDVNTPGTDEYTIADLGAKGRFHPELKKPHRRR